MEGAVALVFIVLFVSGFAMLFGIYYLRTRKNLAMIEKNMNPNLYADRPAPYKNLKWALLLIGVGVGLFLAVVIDANMMSSFDDRKPGIYMSLIAIGGGVGLFVSYKMEKKWYDENKREIGRVNE